MNKEQFIKLLNSYDEFNNRVREYYKFGIDLMESQHAISPPVDEMFNSILELHYNEFGIDWINWFIFECEFGERQMEAWDEDRLICQNIDELYDYIEQYKK